MCDFISGFSTGCKKLFSYDMVYSEIYGMNQVSVQDVLHILEKNGVTVEQVIQLPISEMMFLITFLWQK